MALHRNRTGHEQVAVARDALVSAVAACAASAKADTSRWAMVDLRSELWTQLKASVREYARVARANGDSVQIVVKNAVDLVRDGIPGHSGLAKLSSDIAQLSIDAYFDKSDS